MSELSQLQSEAKRLAKQVNQRIVRLEREAQADVLSIERLRSKLDQKSVNGWTESGRVRFNNKMNDDQLNAIITAMEQFKKEKTSSISGLKQQLIETRKKAKQPTMSYQDMFDYTVVKEDLESWATQHIQASKYYHIQKWSKEKGKSKKEFADIIIKASEDLTNDEDTVKKINKLYNKYVKTK